MIIVFLTVCMYTPTLFQILKVSTETEVNSLIDILNIQVILFKISKFVWSSDISCIYWI